MNAVVTIWKILTPSQRWQFCVLLFVNIFATAAEVLSVFSVLPFLAIAGDPSLARQQPGLRFIWDFFGFTTDLQFVIAAGVITFLSILLTNVINMGALAYRTWFCNAVVTDMSDRLFRGYLHQPYAFFLTRNTAVLGKDLLNEIQAFYTHSLEAVTVVVARGLQVIAVAAALVAFDWKTALVAAALFGGVYSLIFVFLKPWIYHYGAIRYHANEARFRLAAEALGGAKEVQLFGRQDWYADAFLHECRLMATTSNRLTIASLSPRYVIEVLVFGALVAMVLFGISQGRSFQQLLPSLGVFAVAGIRLLPAVQLLFQYIGVIASSSLAADRLQKLFSEIDGTPRSSVNATAPMRLNEKVCIRNLSFRYGHDKPDVLHAVSLDITAGQCVGICGPSGSGKTTLMDLCLGLIEATSGTITVDGVPLTTKNRAAWQRNIGYVPQSIYLIDGTIAENIAFGADRNSLDMQAVARAARLARLEEFIEGSEQKYETLVGERGVRLSGGQRQRVAIARALYRDPDVLFFDEATSALDTESEALVVEAVQSLAHMKTIIIIAHRLTTLRYCDVIYELRNGRAARTGPYDVFAPQAVVNT